MSRNLKLTEEAWSDVVVSGQRGADLFGKDDPPRRQPVLAVSGNDIWVFWQEFSENRWEIRYNVLDEGGRSPGPPKLLPQKEDSRIEDDLVVLIRQLGRSRRLWLFGARRSRETGRWVITYRVKNGLRLDVADDWSAAQGVLKTTPGASDREPALLETDDGKIELFFSSTRAPDGGWCVFRTVVRDVARNAWETPEPVVNAAGSQRAALAVRITDGTLLLYRSSEPIQHPLETGGHVVDSRYTGTTTFRGKVAATQGSFDDVQTYTHTAPGGGPSHDGRFGRGAVGLFLVPAEARDKPLTRAEREVATSRLEKLASEFMPINTRAIFITPT
jgi:hypothetical protein